MNVTGSSELDTPEFGDGTSKEVPERIFVFEQTSPGTTEFEFNVEAFDNASREQLHAELDALYGNDPTGAQKIWPGYELVQRAY
ncbi:MAG TPA: hypothetical protein VF647_10400 [Longimicrobium sp.]|jgi:hypothetical protein